MIQGNIDNDNEQTVGPNSKVKIDHNDNTQLTKQIRGHKIFT